MNERNGKDLDGSGRGLIEELSWRFLGGPEETHKKSHSV
jgi:hypothetical protein